MSSSWYSSKNWFENFLIRPCEETSSTVIGTERVNDSKYQSDANEDGQLYVSALHMSIVKVYIFRII